MTEFQNVVPALAAALTKRGYVSLTPVQTCVLEEAPGNADLLVSAQTGSGKTVAFGLALAENILKGEDTLPPAGAPVALAIAPTRELALQVKEELTWLYAETGAQTASCVGGMDPRTERRTLDRGTHIVVGTPGRLRDHIERGALDLSDIRAVVLDEADEMLDMGFREDLEYILDAAPEERRTLLFSATVSRPIAELAKRFQKDAVRLSTINTREQHGDIQYVAHPVPPNERENAIINVLRLHEAEKAIVFCSTREAVSRLTSRLANRGFAIVSLSGELSQEQRSSALAAMKDGRARVCVATDVAARGIDLPNLDLVIHADLPTGKEALLHRSGRTGRAGRKGTCVLMVPFPRRRQAERLLKMANIRVTWNGAPTAEEIYAKDRERLLADPALTAELSEETVDIAKELAERYDATQLAAAFVNLRQAKMPAPEDVSALGQDALDGRTAGSKGGRVAEISGKFESGIWFRLSLGHKHRADPRWLLPMICRAGHVTKKNVGAIRIYQNETHFEIDQGSGAKYAEVIRENGSGENNVTISVLDARGGKPPAPPAFKDRGSRDQDYENFGAEDRMDKRRPQRRDRNGPGPRGGDDRGFAGKGFGGKGPGGPGRKRRRSEDGDEGSFHPAYAPLDTKTLENKGNSDAPRSRKPREHSPRSEDSRAPFKAGKRPGGDKKKSPKNKPSRAQRKAAKTKD